MLPQLEALYKKWHDDGLEVVGISFDQNVAQTRKTLDKLKVSYPQVLVPDNDKARRLWQRASGIGALPRLLLIDREGILQVNGHIEDLEQAVADLLEGKHLRARNQIVEDARKEIENAFSKVEKTAPDRETALAALAEVEKMLKEIKKKIQEKRGE